MNMANFNNGIRRFDLIRKVSEFLLTTTARAMKTPIVYLFRSARQTNFMLRLVPGATLPVRILGMSLLCWLGVSSCSLAVGAQEEDTSSRLKCVISLSSGSLLNVEMEDQYLLWTDLATPAKGTQEKQIRLSQTQQIVISKQSGAKQLEMVRRYLSDLKDENGSFEFREIAEKELSKPELGGRYRFIIETEKNHPVLEVRHRIQRILGALNKLETTLMGPLDQIQMRDGGTLNGDIGNQQFECSFRGKPLRLERNQIESITVNSHSQRPAANVQPVAHKTEVVQRMDPAWSDNHLFVDFELSPAGEPLASRTDVSNLYVSQGLIMSSEKPGYIGISGYPFRADCPPKDNSICVFESVGSAFQRFKGVMEFRFCRPHQNGVQAGVNEFGLFVSRVDNARDFILEAYNSEGHILGTVEASDANCVFMGIRSAEPIAKLRLLSNPYLFNLKRKVDEDFCVDNIYFSPPQKLFHESSNPDPNITTMDGEILVGPWQIKGESVRIVLQGTELAMEFPLAEIRSLSSGNAVEPLAKGQRIWYAMLKDRTILEVSPSEGLTTGWFDNQKIRSDDLVSLWLAPNGLRFPLLGDFDSTGDNAGAVLVYPTGRYIVNNLKLSERGVSWKSSSKRQQDLWIRTGDGGRNSEEDPTPDLLAIDFASTSPEQIPTFWTRSPPNYHANHGRVLLTSGQQFVLGGELGIEFEAVSENSLRINWNGKHQDLPISQISKIVFPITKTN